MAIVEEFKKFALKGNVVDLAVGVVIGAAFGKIVSSLVDNLIMPPIGLIIGGMDFSDLKIVLAEASEGQAEVALGYGVFVQQIVNFLIVAWALFLLIRFMNKLYQRQAQAPSSVPVPPSEEILLLREIRDSLKRRQE